ncbi:hypothetical protein G6031_13085 [Dietzia sp. CQ4]|uniref:hypothetical protein n=1 Tax=Dietzia sp. (strain CQ4) TaxID=370437 RepID=UPI0015FD72A9|nr:hypothetical protein [Dietzia sp. CQ4]MBB1035312.1 hypothetical protein [Dietzia sp. CQ4]
MADTVDVTGAAVVLVNRGIIRNATTAIRPTISTAISVIITAMAGDIDCFWLVATGLA